jgi:hypothetical protein
MLWFLVNYRRDAKLFTMYLFLFLFLALYMFRAHRAHHQERQIVSTQPLVTVTLHRWPCLVRVGSSYHVFIFIFNSLDVSSTSYSSSGETDCVNTTSGNCHSVSVAVSCAGRKFHFRPAQDTVTDAEWQLPEVVLTQFVSPDDEHDVLETCRELKIKINT